MNKEGILNAAKKCVCGDRENQYGSPEDSFGVIAKLWEDYLSARGEHIDIEPKDVASMMALLKIARVATDHGKTDNWVDIAGYAACGGELEDMEGVCSGGCVRSYANPQPSDCADCKGA